MAIQVYSGSFSREKLTFIFDQLSLPAVKGSNSPKTLFVVPNRRFSTLLERYLSDYFSKQAISLPEIKSIDTVWNEILLEQPDQIKIEQQWQKRLFIRLALNNHDFIPKHLRHFWLPMVQKTLQWFEFSGLQDVNLLSDSPSDLTLKKIKRFEQIYTDVLTYREQSGFISREQLSDYLPSETTYFSTWHQVIFISLDEYDISHWQWLVRQTFSHPCCIFSIDATSQDKQESLPHLHQALKLFSKENLTEIPSEKPNPTHTFWSFPAPWEEISAIADEIKRLHSQGTPLHDMCLVFKTTGNYPEWIEKIFSKNGIPFNISTGQPIQHRQMTIFFRLMIRLLKSDLNASTLQTYFNHSLVGYFRLANSIEQLAIQFGDSDQLTDWIEWADQMILSMENTHDQEEKKQQFIRLKNQLSQVLTDIQTIQTETSIEKVCDYLHRWIWKFINYQNVADRDKIPFEEWSVLQSITDVLKDISQIEKWKLPLTFSDIIEIISDRVQNLSWYSPIRNGVQILGPLELQGKIYQQVFVIGIDEDVYTGFPDVNTWFTPQEVPLLSDYQEVLKNKESSEFYRLSQVSGQYITWSWTRKPEHSQEIPNFRLQELANLLGKTVQMFPHKYHTDETISGKASQLFSFIDEGKKYRKHAELLGGLTPFDGIFSPSYQPIAESVVAQTIKHFSANSLDKWGTCPFTFFTDKLLGIEEKETYSDEWDPTEKGTIVHTIMEQFYKNNPDLIQDWDQEKAATILWNMVNNEVDHLKSKKYITFKERMSMEKLVHQNNSPISDFLKAENMLRKRMKPIQLEWGFGENYPFIITTPHGRTVNLKGKIDRIDYVTVTSEPFPYIVIFDYKTSRNLPHISLMLTYRKFQLPLYMMIVSESNEFSQFLPVAGAYYYQLTGEHEKQHEPVGSYFGLYSEKKLNASRSHKTHLIESLEELQAFIFHWKHHLGKIIDSIYQGNYPLNPTAGGGSNYDCPSYCHLKYSCGIKSLRQQTMNGNIIGDLDED